VREVRDAGRFDADVTSITCALAWPCAAGANVTSIVALPPGRGRRPPARREARAALQTAWIFTWLVAVVVVFFTVRSASRSHPSRRRRTRAPSSRCERAGRAAGIRRRAPRQGHALRRLVDAVVTRTVAVIASAADANACVTIAPVAAPPSLNDQWNSSSSKSGSWLPDASNVTGTPTATTSWSAASVAIGGWFGVSAAPNRTRSTSRARLPGPLPLLGLDGEAQPIARRVREAQRRLRSSARKPVCTSTANVGRKSRVTSRPFSFARNVVGSTGVPSFRPSAERDQHVHVRMRGGDVARGRRDDADQLFARAALPCRTVRTACGEEEQRAQEPPHGPTLGRVRAPVKRP
jgi:hypothetical protein